jgi:hypothetical protein
MSRQKLVGAGGETTTLTKNTKQFNSLKATVPMFIVKQWGLKPGDKLEWSFEILRPQNEMAVVVRKAGQQTVVDTTKKRRNNIIPPPSSRLKGAKKMKRRDKIKVAAA